MSNDKDFKVKKGVKPTVYHEKLGTVVSGTDYYSLSGASYDSKSFSVATQEGNSRSLVIKPDGLSFYIVGVNNDTVYQYSMSTAWDISTASYASKSFSVAGQEINPNSIFFKPDGTKMYVLGATGDDVNEYNLSTAWDVTTASYVQVFSVASQETTPTDLQFKPDGTKMYVSGNNNRVYQYNLSTAWDVSTASYSSSSADVSGTGSSIQSAAFNADGTRLFVSYTTTQGTVYLYTLSTAWDISTASYASVSFTPSQSITGAVVGLTFGNNGAKMYLMDYGTDLIYQYSTTIASETLDLSTGSVFQLTPSSNIQLNLSNPAASGTVSGATLLLGNTLLNAWDISTASILNTFSVSAQDIDMEGIFLKPDGAKIYSVGYAGDTVEEYDMSTPYNLSTASYVRSFSVTAQETVPSDVFFKSDGTKMYVCGYTGQDINEYSLSTAWNISTASFIDTFSVSSQTTQPDGIAFKPDGTKLYVIGGNNQTVFQYSVATAWDVSTSVYDNKSFSTSSQDVSSRGVRFKPDGTRMFVVGTATDSVYEYSLSTAWDVTTASYVRSFSTGVSNPAGVDFSSDGANMYITDANNDNLLQYSVGSGATITYDPSIDFPGGTAPTSPAIGDTDVLVFTTRDGGTSYKASLAIDGAK